jgi:hypothetical protein
MTNGKKIKHTKNLDDAKMYISPENISKLIEELLDNNFNVSKACETIGIKRSVYYYNLRFDTDFSKALNFTRDILSNIVSNSLMEGLSSNDLIVKHKYLELLAKGNVLSKLLGIEIVEEGVSNSGNDVILT